MEHSGEGKRKRKISLNQKTLKTFAESILRCLASEKLPVSHEPFEDYAHNLKIRLFTHEPNFPDRFVKGYEVIVTTLCDLQK